MKNYKFKIHGNVYEVEVLDIDGSMAKIEVNGTLYEVEVQKELPKPKAAQAVLRPRIAQVKETASTATTGSGKSIDVKAPLPGVIIQVLSKPGDDVARGQTLCTLETMKMENAIKADKAGKITAVNVNSGQSVLQDEVLIVMTV